MSTGLETARLVIRSFEQRDAEPWIEGLASYYGFAGLKKYVAERDDWKSPALRH